MIISAGAVLFKIENDKIKLKLVKTKKRWGLAKGRIENNESIETAALREVYEEAGVKAKLKTYLGEASWKLKSGEKKTVHLFLAECVKDGDPNDPDKEIVKAEWKSVGKALDLIEFSPMKKILIKAVEILEEEYEK